MAISVVSFSFSRVAQLEARGLSWLSLPHLLSNSSDLQLNRESRGPLLLGGGFPYHILSPTHLSSNSLTSCLHHSISLEWHVWSSSSGNFCHAVHRSLSSGASVYECTMGFYLVPYFQPSLHTRFLLITAIGMCHFLPVHHLGMACLAGSKVNIQHLRVRWVEGVLVV